MDELTVSDIEPNMVDPVVFPVVHVKEDEVSRLQVGQRDRFSILCLFP